MLWKLSCLGLECTWRIYYIELRLLHLCPCASLGVCWWAWSSRVAPTEHRQKWSWRSSDYVNFLNPVFRIPFFRIPFSESDCPSRIPFSESDYPGQIPFSESDCPGRIPFSKSCSRFPNPVLESRFLNPTVRAESRFPNPTVRAGSASRLKRGTVASNGRTHVVNLYIRFANLDKMKHIVHGSMGGKIFMQWTTWSS
jgi:hypothetical protein